MTNDDQDAEPQPTGSVGGMIVTALIVIATLVTVALLVTR
jgi:hypothetical protein